MLFYDFLYVNEKMPAIKNLKHIYLILMDVLANDTGARLTFC